jgi:hypothetical protein
MVPQGVGQRDPQAGREGDGTGMIAPRDLGQAGLHWGLAGFPVAGHGLVFHRQQLVQAGIHSRHDQLVELIKELAAVQGRQLFF